MFDEWMALDDAALLRSMSDSLRTERTATAHRVIAAGVLAIRRERPPEAPTALWTVDDLDVAIAEIGAELGISRHRARTDTTLGICLIRRLPELAARFLAGDVDLRVIAVIDERTMLIQDPDILAALDTRLAAAAPHWNALSKKKLIEVLDWLVLELDPDAHRVATQRRDERYVTIYPGQNGMSDIVGTLPAERAAVIEQRLADIADTVCRDDPRTLDQRRADALFALADGQTHLDCECATNTCTATTATDSGASGSQVVIYVLADQPTLDGTSNTPALIPGHGPIPADTVRQLAASPRATIRPVPTADALHTESSYRPSRGLAAFLVSRDLTCRWPGCSHPAQNCDTDHTIPWPYGPTHPSNTKKYCRHHRLMKTSWCGPGGWHDSQSPDGTVTFTSPSGLIYTTTPLGAWFFPQLGTPTSTPPATRPPPEPHSDKTIKMPRRQRSRANERHRRITDEREVNVVKRLAHPPPF